MTSVITVYSSHGQRDTCTNTMVSYLLSSKGRVSILWCTSHHTITS